MPKVIAYQSTFDKKVFRFDQRDMYIKHLKTLRQKNTDKRRIIKARREFELFRTGAADSLSTVEEIEKWVIDNMETIAYSQMATASHGIDKLSPDSKMIKISFENLKRYNSVSNSHNAPRNGVTNWGNQNKDRPSGYPGLHGRLHMLLETPDSYGSCNISSILTKLGICTGSGGSGSFYSKQVKTKTQISLSYEVTLFDADWPCLAVTCKMNS